MLAALYRGVMTGRILSGLLALAPTLLLLLTTGRFVLGVLAAFDLRIVTGLIVRAVVLILCHKLISSSIRQRAAAVGYIDGTQSSSAQVVLRWRGRKIGIGGFKACFSELAADPFTFHSPARPRVVSHALAYFQLM